VSFGQMFLVLVFIDLIKQQQQQQQQQQQHHHHQTNNNNNNNQTINVYLIQQLYLFAIDYYSIVSHYRLAFHRCCLVLLPPQHYIEYLGSTTIERVIPITIMIMITTILWTH
jgi:heme/copper-type cytochrome/quinol oxidase subunit 3